MGINSWGGNGPTELLERIFRELSGRTRHSDDLIDEIPIAGMALSEAVADRGAKGGGSVAPAVPAEHEFVKMALQVFPAQAMERAKSPSLEVRKDPVDPGHHQMGGPVADNLPGVFAAIEARIARPSVPAQSRRRRHIRNRGMRTRRASAIPTSARRRPPRRETGRRIRHGTLAGHISIGLPYGNNR